MSHGPGCDLAQMAGVEANDMRTIGRMIKNEKFARVPVGQWQDDVTWKKYVPSVPAFVHHTSYGCCLIYGVRSGWSVHSNAIVTIYACRKVHTGKRHQVSPLYAIPQWVRLAGQKIDMVLPLKRMIVHFGYNTAEPAQSKLFIASMEDGKHGGEGLEMSLRDFKKRAQQDNGTEGWRQAERAFLSSNPGAEPYFDRTFSAKEPWQQYDEAGLDVEDDSPLVPMPADRMHSGPREFARVGAPMFDYSSVHASIGAPYYASASERRAAQAHSVVEQMYGTKTSWYTPLCKLPDVSEYNQMMPVGASLDGAAIGAHFSTDAANAAFSTGAV